VAADAGAIVSSSVVAWVAVVVSRLPALSVATV
jgi:hypothetical protein